MRTTVLTVSTGIVALALAGCQSDTNYATGPASQPVLTAPPAGSQTVYSKPIRSKTKTSTWTSPDGSRSVTKTKSRSASVSASVSGDPNALLAEVIGLAAGTSPAYPGGHGAMGPAGALVGKWQLTDGDNFRNCSIDLKSDQSFGAYRAWTQGCFTTDLFQVGKWQLRGYELVLLDFSGTPQASLRITAPNRLDGRIVADGQRISMWR